MPADVRFISGGRGEGGRCTRHRLASSAETQATFPNNAGSDLLKLLVAVVVCYTCLWGLLSMGEWYTTA